MTAKGFELIVNDRLYDKQARSKATVCTLGLFEHMFAV